MELHEKKTGSESLDADACRTEQLRAASRASFSDGINTGFYVNSYTTKTFPTMDGVLEELRRGLERLEQQREEKLKLAAKEQRASELEAAEVEVSEATVASDVIPLAEKPALTKQKKETAFAATMATLTRLSSSYRRCYWKSGSEMLFPILFGHLTFASHRCWTIYTKAPVYLCAEAWRRLYGASYMHQAKKQGGGQVLLYMRSGFDDYPLVGWKECTGDDGTPYFEGPLGDRCDTLAQAYDMQVATALCSGARDDKTARCVTMLQRWLAAACRSQDVVQADVAEDLSHSRTANVMGVSDTGDVSAVLEESQHMDSVRRPLAVTSSAMDDYAFRGEHPLLESMSWYVYSMWMYRVEKAPPAEVSVRGAVQRFVDVPFDRSYKLHKTHMQRVATEFRVPMFEGFSMPPSTRDSETAAMFKQLLTRAWKVEPDGRSAEELLASAVEVFCNTGCSDDTRGAQAASAFTTNWCAYQQTMGLDAMEARHRFLRRFEYQSLWETLEMHAVLSAMAPRGEEAELAKDPDSEHERVTVSQYSALIGEEVALNLEGLARARVDKPAKRREIDIDAHEAYLQFTSGGADEKMRSVDETEMPTLPSKQADVALRKVPWHFDAEDLLSILRFEKRARNSAYGKALLSMPFMRESDTVENTSRGDHRMATGSSVFDSFITADPRVKTSLAEKQILMLKAKNKKQTDSVLDDAEALPDSLRITQPFPGVATGATFDPAGVYSRPSQCVLALVNSLPSTLQLSRDQMLFVAQFAEACDAAWDDMEKPPSERGLYHFLLLGQGGSGKTHVVQNIIFRAVDFIWPPIAGQSRLVVCASSNAQAKNISTARHQAMTVHSASNMRVQSMSNVRMQPDAERKQLLTTRWARVMVLVVEEISMVAAKQYNMLDYRSAWGRAREQDFNPHNYHHRGNAFGRVPIVLHLGDFLQLKPTNQISLLDDLMAKLPSGEWKFPKPDVEIQHAQKIFRDIQFVFELLGTKRFVQDDPIVEFLQCMREGSRIPADVWQAFERRFAADNKGTRDARHDDPHFAHGYGLAIYWEPLSRWMSDRALRDATARGVPLVFFQSVDECASLDRDAAMRNFSQFNPHKTGHMHGVLPLHLGMRVRFTNKINQSLGLVQETTATVVDIAFHHQDRQLYNQTPAGQVFRPVHLPHGVWLQVDNFEGQPLWEDILEHLSDFPALDASPELHTRRIAKSMYFLPVAESQFTFNSTEEHHVTRFGLELSHANLSC